MQLHGRKRWRVGVGEDAFGADLKPGDCLYVPAGTTHVAESLPDSMSIHLTLGLTVPTVGKALQKLIGDVEVFAELRKEVRDSAGVKADLAAGLAAIADAIEAAGESQLLDRLRAAALTHASTRWSLGVSDQLANVNTDALMQLLPHALIRVRRLAEDSSEVTFGARRLVVPWTAAARLLTLDAAPFRLRDVLGAKAAAAGARLGKLLVAEGMAAPVDGEES